MRVCFRASSEVMNVAVISRYGSVWNIKKMVQCASVCRQRFLRLRALILCQNLT